MSNPLGTRLQLSAMLHELCTNVYFQPPSTVQMKFPCVVYQEEAPDVQYADNALYLRYDKFKITYIDRDPDNLTHRLIEELPMCHMTGNPYTADNFYHYVYTIIIPRKGI